MDVDVIVVGVVLVTNFVIVVREAGGIDVVVIVSVAVVLDTEVRMEVDMTVAVTALVID